MARADVRLDAQAVRAVGDGREGAGRDVGGLADRVRGIHHHGRPGLFLEQRGDALVGVVAVAVEGGTGAAGAEQNVGVAERRDVLRGGDELVERAHVDAALEQHGAVGALAHRPADGAEQRVVEGVARPDLQQRHPGVEREPDMLLLHYLGVDRQPGAARGLQQDVERLGVALESVGVGARLPHPAPQQVGAGLLHRVRRLIEIVRVLRVDRALPGDDEQLLPEGDAPEGQPPARQVGAAVHQLEGRLDPVDPVHVLEPLEPVDHQLVPLVADDRVDRAHRADDRLDLAAELRDDRGDLGQLLGREAVGFREDHGSAHSTGTPRPRKESPRRAPVTAPSRTPPAGAPRPRRCAAGPGTRR